MSDFRDLADGGRRLGPLLADALAGYPDAVLLPVLPNGVRVALGIVEAFPLPMRALPVERTSAGVAVPPLDGLSGRTVVVVDDGVETGTVARAAEAALRDSGVGHLVLAVPVCPREAMADLQHRYDVIVAVVKPFARRDLAWHYDDFDTLDEHGARRLLGDANSD